MRNTSIIAALVAALLVGCSSSNVTPTLVGSQNISGITQVPVHGATTKRLVVLSVLAALNIGGIVHKEIVNGNCTLYGKRPHLAVGCHVISAVNVRVRNSSYTYFTGTSGSGCGAATGHFRGRIFRGSSIPILFRWTGNC